MTFDLIAENFTIHHIANLSLSHLLTISLMLYLNRNHTSLHMAVLFLICHCPIFYHLFNAAFNPWSRISTYGCDCGDYLYRIKMTLYCCTGHRDLHDLSLTWNFTLPFQNRRPAPRRRRRRRDRQWRQPWKEPSGLANVDADFSQRKWDALVVQKRLHRYR